MAPSFDGDDRIRLYLLGNLPEQEQSKLEERLMTDDGFFKQLRVIEDELIDDYVHGLLSQADRERFEAHFLSAPERRRQLSFARALDRYVSGPNNTKVAQAEDPSSWWKSLLALFRSRHPALSLAFAAGALLLAAGGTWLAIIATRDEQPPTYMRVGQKGSEPASEPATPVTEPAPQDKRAEDRKPEPSPPPANRSRPAPFERSPSPPPRIAVTVFPVGVRSSGQIGRIRPEPGERSVRLQLSLIEDRYQSYRAEIKKAGHKDKFPPQDRLKAIDADSGRAVFLRIPLDRYSPGDYSVTLMGRNAAGELEDVSTYIFRVLPRE